MTTPTLPLDQVAQRIIQQEAALEALRQEYAARQRQLTDLTRRRQELQTQFDQVEAQIQALTLGNDSPARTASTTKPPAKKPTVQPQTTAQPGAALTLPRFLVQVLQEAKRPLSTRELTDEVLRRRFPTQTGNLFKLVATRVADLRKRGLVRRTADQKIVPVAGSAKSKQPAPVPSKAPAPKAPVAPKAKAPAPKAPVAPKAKAPSSAAPAKTNGPPVSLAAVLTRLLQKHKEPVAGGVLAREALATGYQTRSKNFTNVVQSMLGQMNNVQHTRGQGYRLKKKD